MKTLIFLLASIFFNSAVNLSFGNNVAENCQQFLYVHISCLLIKQLLPVS